MTETPDVTLYREGKALLGKKAGGQITKLLRSFNGDHDQALQAVRLAAEKENPPEYVAGIIRNGQPDIGAILDGI